MLLRNVFILTLSVALGACATTQGNAVPGTSIKPPSLARYALERLQAHTKSKYQCSAPRVLSAELAPKQTPKALSEIWRADVCGAERRFVMILVPDGTGGTMVAIGE